MLCPPVPLVVRKRTIIAVTIITLFLEMSIEIKKKFTKFTAKY